jgi:protein ImuB
LWALVECAVEHGGGDEGLTRFEVAVPVFEPLAHAQMSIHRDRAAEVSQAVNDLFDRLTARLGDEVITQPKPVESYMPERACQSVAVVDRAAVKATSPPLLPRPARLLCDPEPIRVTVSPSPDGEPVAFIHGESYHKLQHIRGPERLGGEWWRGRFKERDYFDVESHTGERFWVFRVNQTLRWFLHGVFE